MPYIGTSPSNGVRRVHTYTATEGQTTFTGASNEGQTLSYVDTNYIDVYQNGVLLGTADYTSTSGTSVVLAQGASVSDIIVITVYDVFSVADTVSKTSGGTFDSAVTVNGAFTSQGIDDNADATAITIDSSENVSFNGGVTIGGTTGSSQLSFLSATDSTNTINFGDSGDADIGLIQYNHSDNNMDFHANTDKVMRIQGSSGIVVQGEDEDWCAQFRSSDSSGTRYFLDFRISGTIAGSAGTQVGYVLYNGTSTVYNTSSDYRLKENVSYTWDATTRLKQLKPCRFNFISNPSNTVDGFLAHEVSSIVPESIHGEKDAVDSEGNIIPQGIDHSKLVPLLVKTIQELEARIAVLESK